MVGTACLEDCLPAIDDEDAYRRAFRYHRVPPAQQAASFAGGWRTPWVLHKARRVRTPVPYPHPAGAVIWVTLPPSVVAKLPSRRC